MEDESSIKPFLCEDVDKAVIKNEWEKWLSSLEGYFEAEKVKDPLKRRSKLLHLGGPQLQAVACNLPGGLEVHNAEETPDVYQPLVVRLTEYFSLVQSPTFARYVFRRLVPRKGESFNEFFLKVRGQARKCYFGSSNLKSTELNIKDKIIDAWAPPELRVKLLEKERPLKEMIELCQAHEEIFGQTKATPCNSSALSLAVNKIPCNNRLRSDPPCSSCGTFGHFSGDVSCYAKSKKCHKCGGSGHFPVFCTNRRLQKRPMDPDFEASQPPAKRRRSSNNLTKSPPDSDEPEQVSAPAEPEVCKESR